MMTPAPINTDLEWLRDSLDHINGKLDSVVVAQARYEARCAAHHGVVDELKLTVFGNGKPGLAMRVDRLEQSRLAIKATVGVLAVVVGAAIGEVARWLAGK